MSQIIKSLPTTLILFFALSIISEYVVAQCSDAGVCAVGKHTSSAQHYIGQVGVSYVFGRSKKADDITYHAVYLDANLQIFANSRLTASIPWAQQSGPLGSVSGIGDLTLLWNQTVLSVPNGSLSVQLGGKFATADVNRENLPQQYQSGLGTNDLIIGASYETEPWNAAIGYQISRGRSKNTINKLKRGDDFLLRLGYAANVVGIKTGAEVLAIKRLQQSSVLSSPSGTAFVDLPDSDQFQINLLGKASIPVHDTYTVQTLVALPILQRKVTVDGLTRSITLSIGLSIGF